MEPTEKELIDHIRKVLISEEFAYKEGAWEKFSEQQESKKTLIPWVKIFSAAAVLCLVVFSVWYKSFNTRSIIEHRGKVVQTNLKKPVINAVPEVSVPGAANRPAPAGDAARAVKIGKSERAVEPTFKTESAIRQPFSSDAGSKVYAAMQNPVQQEPVVAALNNRLAVNSGAIDTLGAGQQKNNSALKAKESLTAAIPSTAASLPRKRTLLDLPPESTVKTAAKEESWKFGLTLAQGAGTETKISSGYGLAIGYQLNSRFSINSGVAYTYTKAEKDINTIGVNEVGNGLSSKQTNFGGIDFPLELSYALNKKFYVSAGVSANVILSQKDVLSYMNNSIQASSYVISEGGEIGFKGNIVSTKTEVDVPKDEITSSRYVGYYNFSIGYQQKLPEGNILTIEPFLKLPTQEFSNDKLKLNIIGVRLRYALH